MTQDKKNHFGSIDYVQLAIYPLILVFGAIGNTLVRLVVKNKKRNRKINDYFILNLAISDLFMLTISICVDFYLKFQASPYGNVLCKGIWPFMTMCLFSSVFTLTYMALERWRTIVKPLCPRFSLSILYLLIALTWFAGLIFVLPLIIVAYHQGRKCKEDWPTFAIHNRHRSISIPISFIDHYSGLRKNWKSLKETLKKNSQNCRGPCQSTGCGKY